MKLSLQECLVSLFPLSPLLSLLSSPSFTSGGVAEARGDFMCNLGSLWETSGMQILTLPLLQDCDWGACFLRSLWDSELFSFADKGCPTLHKLTVGNSCSFWQGQFNSFRVYSNPGAIWRLPRCDTLFPSPCIFVELTPGYYEGPWKLNFLSTADWKTPDVLSSHLSF